MLIQLVQYHAAVYVLFQVDHHPDAPAVAFVPQVLDAVDALFVDQVGDLLHQAGFVHLVGDLGDDDAAFAPGHGFHLGPGPHHHLAPAGAVGLADAAGAHDQAAGGEVRAGDIGHELLDGDIRVIDHGHIGVDHLPQVMGGDVGGHAHGDAAAAVDQKVGVAAG